MQDNEYLPKWPTVGDKIKFKGTHHFWFVNMIKDAEELLLVGKEYTIKQIKVHSSWCSIVLKELPDKKFPLSFFSYETL